MEGFSGFKQALLRVVAGIPGPADTERELLRAIDESEDWQKLGEHIENLRTLARRRQQESVETIEPLARKAEGLVQKAKETRISVVRKNLLRQAEGYLHEIETIDEPARVYAANVRLLTDLLKHIRRAAAMREQGVSAATIDAITSRVEESVSAYEELADAARSMADADRPVEEQPLAVAPPRRATPPASECQTQESVDDDLDARLQAVETRLFGLREA
ncbi:MAG: hypothetical protein KA184_03965 [Candidatus Hydrogenedentes bacterium]|nr:hypothetical protein [Candidatus Hydrogenedentota bacterium]